MEQTGFDFGLSHHLPLPEGFRYTPEFLSAEEEMRLIGHFSKIQWQLVKMHGVIAKRRVAHFGLDYGYESWKLSDGPPVPEFVEPIAVKAAMQLGVAREEIAALLITHYPAGAGIGWHRDAPMFGESVFGVSLGSSCTMKFRREVGEEHEVVKVELHPRSMYVISGPSRSIWQHSIPAVKADRYSITVRTRRKDFVSKSPPRC